MRHFTNDGRVKSCSLCVAGSTARCIRDLTTLFSNPPHPYICCLELPKERPNRRVYCDYTKRYRPTSIRYEPHEEDTLRGRSTLCPGTLTQGRPAQRGHYTRLRYEDDRSLPRLGCQRSKGSTTKLPGKAFPVVWIPAMTQHMNPGDHS